MRLQVQRLACSAPVALGLWLATPVAAQNFELEDLLQLIVLERQIVAIDAEGGERRAKLEIGEEVAWKQSRGRVGVAITNRRLLAVSAGTGSWQSVRFLRTEVHPVSAKLGDRVALAMTNHRALGFDGGSGNIVESRIGTQEAVTHTEVSANVVVVATTRRALGLSPFKGGFFETRVGVQEKIKGLDLAANIGTLTTSKRLLIFRAPSGSWSESRIEIR